jgi:hypothetical protein
MAEDETRDTSGNGESEHGGLTVVAIPEDQAQVVLDFIASLQQDEVAEVSGHMISTGLAGGLAGGPLQARGTLTNCQNVTGVKPNFDKTCYDSDKW